MSGSERIPVLVGAGLVKDAGLPTSIELAQRLKDTLQLALQDAVPRGGIKNERTRARLILATFYFLNGAIRFQEGVLDRDPDRPINIEQIAVAALELQERMQNPLAPYASGWHQRIIELEQQRPEVLSEFVDFIYSQLDRWLTLADDQSLSYLTRLTDICDLCSGIDVFSLNYDLCIEKALTGFGKQFVNGFSVDAGWQPSLFSEDAQIRLFKLHGSLDWADDQIYGLCSLEHPPHREKESIVHDNLRPLLIFGTAHKLSPKEPFLSLAYYFAQAVLKAPLLLIVGYSFGDEYVNRIVEQGIRKNPKLRVIVVSPSAGSDVRRQLFLNGQPRVSIISRSAKDAFNDNLVRGQVARLLKEASTEEPFK